MITYYQRYVKAEHQVDQTIHLERKKLEATWHNSCQLMARDLFWKNLGILRQELAFSTKRSRELEQSCGQILKEAYGVADAWNKCKPISKIYKTITKGSYVWF